MLRKNFNDPLFFKAIEHFCNAYFGCVCTNIVVDHHVRRPMPVLAPLMKTTLPATSCMVVLPRKLTEEAYRGMRRAVIAFRLVSIGCS